MAYLLVQGVTLSWLITDLLSSSTTGETLQVIGPGS